MKPIREFGLGLNLLAPEHKSQMIEYINLKLATLGYPFYEKGGTRGLNLAKNLIQNFREKNRLLDTYLPPADKRIQDFLNSYLEGIGLESIPRLPSNTLTLDRYGMARELSFPPDGHKVVSPTLTSYRVYNGVLHNPLNDRRTTKGVFHVTEGGLPVPVDKKEVPKVTFARLLEAAFRPPEDLMTLPFTTTQEKKAQTWVSLLLRPIVVPEVPGFIHEKSMEIRFFAPGSLICNLDFVESIFGNAGDPYIPAQDSGLDPQHWTGHTGCIILATHLTKLRKRDVGLPKFEDATERQKRDGMCWKTEDELYNDGGAFKITTRDERGVMVTIVADNYFGYSKKEIKTQISYSANLYGLAEEEHAGGALTYPRYNLGIKFLPDSNLKTNGQTFLDVQRVLGDNIDVQPLGYAIDKHFNDIIYLPGDAIIDMEDQTAYWYREGQKITLDVRPNFNYFHPSGYKVHMEQHPSTKAWRLVGTVSEGTLCHKPCTVSGGGKSEISKSIWDAISFSPITIGDFKTDLDMVQDILDKDYSKRFIVEPDRGGQPPRTLLSNKRSLGSVIKLFTPSPQYTPEFNTWLESLPHRIKALVFLVKRFYQPEWGSGWREHFSVDVVNGAHGNVLKFDGRPLMGSYLRMGLSDNGTWWTFKLRQDFMPSEKVQWEDDITASVIVPARLITGLNSEYTNPSVKMALNCEYRFFQRPDEAVHRGYDKQTEKDMSGPDNFISNFEPFPREAADSFLSKSISFSEYSEPMQTAIHNIADDSRFEYFVVSSNPRIVDGGPSKNPRYLQMDPALLKPRQRYIADVGVRLARMLDKNLQVHHPVNAVLPGRRNNPSEPAAKIRPLAVYNPIHFQELPELFMDFLCSLTGKSPSTTGAGSEGALTKGPFNALVPTTDLNNALLGMIITDYHAFSTAAGYIGPRYRVDHDISLLVPEVWSRMSPQERDPYYLIKSKCLEKIENFEFKGRTIHASRLGYRITREFCTLFLGRIFDDPGIVFVEEMLKPELQSMEDFVDGIENITEAQHKVALEYFEDNSVESAIPPLKAILHIMAHGTYEGKDISHPDIRKLFQRENVLASDWYRSRLVTLQERSAKTLENQIAYMEKFLQTHQSSDFLGELNQPSLLEWSRTKLSEIRSQGFIEEMTGTIGADPLFRL